MLCADRLTGALWRTMAPANEFDFDDQQSQGSSQLRLPHKNDMNDADSGASLSSRLRTVVSRRVWYGPHLEVLSVGVSMRSFEARLAGERFAVGGWLLGWLWGVLPPISVFTERC